MQILATELDGRLVNRSPAAWRKEEVIWVAAEHCCQFVGVECKEVDGQRAIRFGDLRMPLGESQLQALPDGLFVRFDAFAETLDLQWGVEAGLLSVLRD